MNLKNKKILVAEDDEMGRELMADIFEVMECKVDFAVDGVEAVKKFKEKSYDLILMDVRMPNKDGISATKEIRALENNNKRIPIIILTASILEEDKKKCFDAGVNDFILKPIRLEELRAKIRKFLDKE